MWTSLRPLFYLPQALSVLPQYPDLYQVLEKSSIYVYFTSTEFDKCPKGKCYVYFIFEFPALLHTAPVAQIG